MRNMQLFGQSKKKKKGQKYLRFRYLIQMITKHITYKWVVIIQLIGETLYLIIFFVIVELILSILFGK